MEESESTEKASATEESNGLDDNRLDTSLQEDHERINESEIGVESRENMKNREVKTSTMEINSGESIDREKSLTREDEAEDDESKVSDDDENNKEKIVDEKRDNESSTRTSSTSTSDDESETSSEEKTETSKHQEIDETILNTSDKTSKDNKPNEETSKVEDTTDDSDIDDDLVSTINYNTITSLAALKDMLQSSGEDSDGVDSFFHHYFLSHVNRLPSRNQTHSPYPWGRRLSECREEDEYETEEGEFVHIETIPILIIDSLMKHFADGPLWGDLPVNEHPHIHNRTKNHYVNNCIVSEAYFLSTLFSKFVVVVLSLIKPRSDLRVTTNKLNKFRRIVDDRATRCWIVRCDTMYERKISIRWKCL